MNPRLSIVLTVGSFLIGIWLIYFVIKQFMKDKEDLP